MRRIPIDAQYDEPARPAGYDAFHFERIPERRLPGDSPLAPQRHDALLQVLYVRGGTGQVAFDGIRHALATPCLVLLPARTPHAFEFSPGIDALAIRVAQHALEAVVEITAPSIAPGLRRAALIPVRDGDRTAAMLMPLFELIEVEFRGTAHHRATAGMALLVALFVQVARLGDLAQRPTQPGSERRDAQLEQFRELIALHCRGGVPNVVEG